MIEDLTELSRQDADALLEKSGKRVKLALLMHWTGLDAETGENLLTKHQGNLRSAIKSIDN
jgi:N-acetylmuramic acid 6-phosphate etherase